MEIRSTRSEKPVGLFGRGIWTSLDSLPPSASDSRPRKRKSGILQHTQAINTNHAGKVSKRWLALSLALVSSRLLHTQTALSARNAGNAPLRLLKHLQLHLRHLQPLPRHQRQHH
jgi:hypothetical protein